MALPPDINQYKELARRFGISATPESVSRLTQLVARQDSDVDEIVRVIEKDPSLNARLLRVANPHAENPADYSVETASEALMRNGIGCALLLAMSTPLAMALEKTFKTMLAHELKPADTSDLHGLFGPHMLGSIGFAGKIVGHVYLRMSLPASKEIAAGILGLEPKDLTNDDVKDAIGELLNIMTGNFKSNLCDAGLDCKLEPPQVGITEDYSTPIQSGGGLERLAFSSDKLSVFVEVTANPWNDD
jgi:chemotaxis protein CheX